MNERMTMSRNEVHKFSIGNNSNTHVVHLTIITTIISAIAIIIITKFKIYVLGFQITRQHEKIIL